MEKYKNKYRIKPARRPRWDYGFNAFYFITICTYQNQHFFGKIKNGRMHLSDMGKIADTIWLMIAARYPFAKLHNHIIMPNHMHALIEFAKPLNDAPGVQTRFIASPPSHPNNSQNLNNPSNPNLPPNPTLLYGPESQINGGITQDHNPMLYQNLSNIMRWYKGRCTYEIRKRHSEFRWLSRFYDSILRGEGAYDRVQNYIANNPQKWEQDKFYTRR